jgi:hypothetical protein
MRAGAYLRLGKYGSCYMRGFPSDPLRPLDRQRTLSELDAPNDHEPLVSVGVLGRLGLLLLVILSLAMVAQILVGVPH